MASKTELAEKLSARFEGVPLVDATVTENWIERSMLEHGYSADEDVDENDILLVLLYAEWDGALQLALRTSYYFQYDDSDESVDKRMVSEAYRNVADKLEKSYQRKRNEIGRTAGPTFRIMTRADR